MKKQETMTAEEYLRNHAREIAAQDQKRKRLRIEEGIQRASAQYMALVYPLAFHVANERGSEIERMMQKALGVKSGVSDWCIPVPGGCWWIELKAPGKKQSESQVAFQRAVERIPGHRYAVAHSLDEMVRTLDVWRALKPDAQDGHGR